MKLVLVTPRNKFLDRIVERSEQLGVRNRIVTTGFVPDPELKLLLNQAQAFVFPSKSEGFGLPGLEAMGVGCPVIAAEATSLPEIYDEAAEYFDPENPKELVKKVHSVVKNQKLKENLVAQGYQQVRKYSWKSMAEQTLKVYKMEARN